MSSPFEDLTRRQFLVGTGAAVLAGRGLPLEGQTNAQGAFVMPPPKAITGGVKPLTIGHTARPLRYRPVDGDFVIRNGGEFFNRPLYGQNINFRVDAGDLPEFSFYLPGHGGNLKVGISSASESKWLSQAAEVVARYRPGRMVYEISDPLLGAGSLHIEALTTGTGPGFMLRVEPRNVPASVSLTFAFAGVSGRKGARNGDIGCENEPVSFNQLVLTPWTSLDFVGIRRQRLGRREASYAARNLGGPAKALGALCTSILAYSQRLFNSQAYVWRKKGAHREFFSHKTAVIR